VMRVAGLAQLPLVDRLRRVDLLVHERGEALLELDTALTWLEIHRFSFDGEDIEDKLYGWVGSAM
jgi:hypothetical protein